MTREEMKLRIRNLESRIDHWKAVADSRWKMILALTGRSSETLEDALQAQQEGWRWAKECEEKVKELQGDLDKHAAKELRRLHEVNQELVEALEGIVEAHVVPSTVCKDRPAYEQAKAALAKAR
ncbi:MAG: hypothetical protein Q7U57_00055 [Methylovulum sp.]|nr:hypothetical protein [Methylovulum sp.]